MLATFIIVMTIVFGAAILIAALKAAFSGGGSNGKKVYHLVPIEVKNHTSHDGWFFVLNAYRETDGPMWQATIVDCFGKERETVFATSAEGLENEILKEYARMRKRNPQLK